MEILLAFDTTTIAIRAEKTLLDESIPVKVMNIPSSIKAGCGISLRISPADFPRSINILKENHLPVGGFYTRLLQDGKNYYEPFQEETT